jgi:hypothetical protein
MTAYDRVFRGSARLPRIDGAAVPAERTHLMKVGQNGLRHKPIAQAVYCEKV